MKFDPKDPHVRIQLLQEKILRQRSALKSQRITILELQARLRKPEVRLALPLTLPTKSTTIKPDVQEAECGD